jgi:hypothetical protein
MTLRTGHGSGAGMPRVEVLPADELPRGVPSNADEACRTASTETGRFAVGNRRSVLGGRSRQGQSRLASRLGLACLPDSDAFAPYRRAAATYRRIQVAELAKSIGGGHCGPGPASIVSSAALALAWSRFFSDEAARTGDSELAMRSARLGETSRQHLLAAHELCAREAKCRKDSAPWSTIGLAEAWRLASIPSDRNE